VEVLRGERHGRLRDLSIVLTGHLAALAGVAPDAGEGQRQAAKALDGGAGLERLRAFVAAKGGDPAVLDDLSLLPQAPVHHDVTAPRSGWLAEVDAEAVGRAAAGLGAGRQRIQDRIDPAVAVELAAKLGDLLAAGDRIGRVLARDQAAAETAARELTAALRFSDRPVEPPPLVHQVVAPAT
jgi:pyrimidine-nucleoside phosphorylase